MTFRQFSPRKLPESHLMHLNALETKFELAKDRSRSNKGNHFNKFCRARVFHVPNRVLRSYDSWFYRWFSQYIGVVDMSVM